MRFVRRMPVKGSVSVSYNVVFVISSIKIILSSARGAYSETNKIEGAGKLIKDMMLCTLRDCD